MGPLEGWEGAVDGADWSWQAPEEQGASWSLTAQGSNLAVGMPEVGEVVLYELGADALLTVVARWSGEGALGTSVALGDVEQDGRWDLWMGDPESRLDRGAAYLFRSASTRSGLTPGEADVVVLGLTPGDRLGTQVERCPDLTGDGKPEWLIAAPHLSASPTHPEIPSLAGGVWLVRSELLGRYVGEVEPDALGPLWWSEEVGAGAGAALVCDRDLSGDGIPDIAIGAPLAGRAEQGAVYLLEGARLTASTPGERLTSGPLSVVADRILDGPWENAWVGASLVSADLDADGRADLAVGAPGHDQGRGRVLLYRGVDLIRGAAYYRIAIGPAPSRPVGDHVGTFLAAGDVSGDGQDDLLVGIPDWRDEEGDFDAGRVSVWTGRSLLGWSLDEEVGRDEDLALEGAAPFQRVGRALLVHDLDGDGVEDVLLPTRSP